jgi:hypothetical protein
VVTLVYLGCFLEPSKPQLACESALISPPGSATQDKSPKVSTLTVYVQAPPVVSRKQSLEKTLPLIHNRPPSSQELQMPLTGNSQRNPTVGIALTTIFPHNPKYSTLDFKIRLRVVHVIVY